MDHLYVINNSYKMLLITLTCSAGNLGPSPGTVANVFPWLITVGATTIDRDFEVDVVLGTGKVIKGGANNASSNSVSGSLDVDIEVNGTIVICESFYQCITLIDDEGAFGGIIISNASRQKPIDFGAYTIAAVSVEDGARILSYINSTSNPLATILPTRVIPKYYKPAPVVADFSSRGPIPSIRNLLKPDIVAPGVGIIGAWRLNDTNLEIDPDEEITHFRILSGTSQACPHVSGLVAMVKSRHPTWSPSAIKSAIMTTAINQDNLHAPITTINNGSNATPYDIGAGEISINGPLSPGLIYETHITDYVQFLCNIGCNASTIKTIASIVPSNFSCHSNSTDLISDMNYPSITVSAKEPRTVKRTVTNVGEVNSTYKAIVEAPAGVQVQVVPKTLSFTKNVTKLSFRVKFSVPPTNTSEGALFGSITWSNGKYKVRSPFVVSNV
ncbi:hypothetical protein CASFOL_009897 [Castilleja foliolosa]|uniref:Uncharacterized protein n=1 Tax=Castilleja foliolosa TaxID=1961234 RepID=A0ABD3DTB4_9LAMI